MQQTAFCVMQSCVDCYDSAVAVLNNCCLLWGPHTSIVQSIIVWLSPFIKCTRIVMLNCLSSSQVSLSYCEELYSYSICGLYRRGKGFIWNLVHISFIISSSWSFCIAILSSFRCLFAVQYLPGLYHAYGLRQCNGGLWFLPFSFSPFWCHFTCCFFFYLLVGMADALCIIMNKNVKKKGK